jgi:hypothetical protein
MMAMPPLASSWSFAWIYELSSFLQQLSLLLVGPTPNPSNPIKHLSSGTQHQSAKPTLGGADFSLVGGHLNEHLFTLVTFKVPTQSLPFKMMASVG